MERWDYYAVFRNMVPKTIYVLRIASTGVFVIFIMWAIQLAGGIRKVLGVFVGCLKSFFGGIVGIFMAFFGCLGKTWKEMQERRKEEKLLRPHKLRERKLQKEKVLRLKKAKKAENLILKRQKKAKDLEFYNSTEQVERRAENREWWWRLLPCLILRCFNDSLYLIVKLKT